MKKQLLIISVLMNMFTFGYSLRFDDGYYEIKKLNDHSVFKKSYEMIVQSDEADYEKKYVIIIPEKVLKGYRSGKGYFYQAKTIKNGNAYMLSPISIDLNGNFVIGSENDTRAPVMILSKKFDGDTFTYMLQGRNGGMDNSLFKVEKKSLRKRLPKLRSTPDHGVFASGSKKRGVDLIVNNEMLSLYSNNHIDQEFQMIDINGNGVFSGLARSEWDSMAEFEVGYESVSKLSVFFESYEGKEKSLLIASPGFKKGQYRMDVYKSGRLNWIKKIFTNIFE